MKTGTSRDAGPSPRGINPQENAAPHAGAKPHGGLLQSQTRHPAYPSLWCIGLPHPPSAIQHPAQTRHPFPLVQLFVQPFQLNVGLHDAAPASLYEPTTQWARPRYADEIHTSPEKMPAWHQYALYPSRESSERYPPPRQPDRVNYFYSCSQTTAVSRGKSAAF